VRVPPFWASSRRSVAESILQQEVQFGEHQVGNISPECKDLVRRMLTKDVHQRITATQILGKSPPLRRPKPQIPRSAPPCVP